MPTLEVLMGADHVEDLVTHIRPQDLRRDPGWLGTDTYFPMSWHNDATTISGSVPASSASCGRGLQGMSQLVDGEPVGDVAQRLEHGEDPGSHPGLALCGLGADLGPLLRVRLVHSAEAAGVRLVFVVALIPPLSHSGPEGVGDCVPASAFSVTSQLRRRARPEESPGVWPRARTTPPDGPDPACARVARLGFRTRNVARTPPMAAATPAMNTAWRNPASNSWAWT